MVTHLSAVQVHSSLSMPSLLAPPGSVQMLAIPWMDEQ